MRNPRVLVVDDDAVSLALLCKLVENLRLDVVAAADGAQALDLARREPVNVVVSDYEMPHMNGLELLQQMRTEFQSVPVILVTAYSNTKVIRSAWDQGAFDFFQKPVFVDRFGQTIRLAIEFGQVSISSRRPFTRLAEVEKDQGLINPNLVQELGQLLSRSDLLQMIEEFATHARIELEQLFRLNMTQQVGDVRVAAHRLAGTALNFGLSRIADEMRAIEAHPELPITRAVEISETLEKSICWLDSLVAEIIQEGVA